MIRHIVKRELFDYLNSLRFTLTVLIMAALMVTNAVVHLRTHPEQVRTYSKNLISSRDVLKSRTQLYDLLKEGPGNLYKRPSSLAFVANGGEDLLPESIGGRTNTWSENVEGIEIKSIWWLQYPTVNANAKDLRPKATKIDWSFIITYLLSFVPLLFTFDTFSGEREHGTLRLCLANPISRPTLLIGKFLGAFITVLIPFYFAVLLNLALISTNGWTQLGITDWGRLGLIVFVGSIYAGIFIAVGLMVSATTSHSQLSLMVLVLIWVTVVVFTPFTLGVLATKWMDPVQTAHQFDKAEQAAVSQLFIDFGNQVEKLKQERLRKGNIVNKLRRLLETSPEKAEELMRSEYEKVGSEELHIKAQRVNKDAEIREHLNQQRLNAQLAQVQFARNITRFSPAAVVQYALESMAGTGLNHHLQFLKRVHVYIKQFRIFITETDRADITSPHIMGIPEGMSKKPISLRALPVFEDKITFPDTFNTAVIDLMLLVLLLVGGLSAALLVFIRSDV